MFDALTNRELLTAGLLVCLATVVLVLLLVLLAIAFRRIYRKIEAWQERRRLSLSIQKLHLLERAQLTNFMLLVARVIRAVLTVFVVDAYLSYFLSYFPGMDPLARPLFSTSWRRSLVCGRRLSSTFQS